MSNLTWFKSSHSGAGGEDCIEVALHPTTIHIRDSKNTPTTGPILDVSPAPWADFVAYASSQVSA